MFFIGKWKGGETPDPGKAQLGKTLFVADAHQESAEGICGPAGFPFSPWKESRCKRVLLSQRSPCHTLPQLQHSWKFALPAGFPLHQHAPSLSEPSSPESEEKPPASSGTSLKSPSTEWEEVFLTRMQVPAGYQSLSRLSFLQRAMLCLKKPTKQ